MFPAKLIGLVILISRTDDDPDNQPNNQTSAKCRGDRLGRAAADHSLCLVVSFTRTIANLIGCAAEVLARLLGVLAGHFSGLRECTAGLVAQVAESALDLLPRLARLLLHQSDQLIEV